MEFSGGEGVRVMRFGVRNLGFVNNMISYRPDWWSLGKIRSHGHFDGYVNWVPLGDFRVWAGQKHLKHGAGLINSSEEGPWLFQPELLLLGRFVTKSNLGLQGRICQDELGLSTRVRMSMWTGELGLYRKSVGHKSLLRWIHLWWPHRNLGFWSCVFVRYLFLLCWWVLIWLLLLLALIRIGSLTLPFWH